MDLKTKEVFKQSCTYAQVLDLVFIQNVEDIRDVFINVKRVETRKHLCSKLKLGMRACNNNNMHNLKLKDVGRVTHVIVACPYIPVLLHIHCPCFFNFVTVDIIPTSFNILMDTCFTDFLLYTCLQIQSSSHVPTPFVACSHMKRT